MNTVNINGRQYTAPDGVSVSVINNKVYFNGKLAEDFNNSKEKNIEINIEGNCKELKTDSGNITINGNVEGNVKTDTGNINISGDIYKDVNTDTGNVMCRGNINGNVKTDTGNIGSHHIFGNATTDCGIISKHQDSIISNGNKTYNCRTNKINWFREFWETLFN